ncbi:MAG: helix-turn-helix domain-containing protein [Christensenellales bacterium]
MNLTNLRIKKKMTQTQLADLIGVTSNAVSQYESGKRIPKIHILKKIANVLGCTIDDLLKETKE